MGFDYKRHKEGGGDSMWTSYSDLFLGLSIIFLLLYVTSSLKQGTDGVQQHAENQKLVKEAQELRQQIKAYETIKQNYLNQQASQDEQSTYEELMDKLTLLQEQSKDERDKLQRQAKDNEKKEVALNKYQQLIRNIINSNMIAKSRIKNRDTILDTQDQEISTLEQNVKEKASEIQKSEAQLASTKSQLNEKMKQLESSYRAHKITKKKYEAQQQEIKKAADAKIAQLKAYTEETKKELNQAKNELQETSSKLNQAEGQVAKLGEEKGKLEGELQESTQRHQAEVDRMKGEFEAQKAAERRAFEGQLAKEKLSGAQKAAREAKFKADAEAKARELSGKIADLDSKFKASQGALAKATENLNARKNLAKQIKKNFEKYGVKAEVDEGTGDVLLSFGDQYFDTGRAELKPRMAKILEQAVPAYSASLFENGKIAKKIQSVEIVGFASPTYKGKYVDPTSLDPENRQAVNYNLDLSYGRARAIFNHVFDQKKMTFKYQQELLPLVKVTGRSFLASDKERDPAVQSGTESFCRKNDCAKLQKVIIKFTLKD